MTQANSAEQYPDPLVGEAIEFHGRVKELYEQARKDDYNVPGWKLVATEDKDSIGFKVDGQSGFRDPDVVITPLSPFQSEQAAGSFKVVTIDITPVERHHQQYIRSWVVTPNGHNGRYCEQTETFDVYFGGRHKLYPPQPPEEEPLQSYHFIPLHRKLQLLRTPIDELLVKPSIKGGEVAKSAGMFGKIARLGRRAIGLAEQQ